MGRGPARGGGTGQIHAGRLDLAVGQPAAGLSDAAAVSGSGGSGVENWQRRRKPPDPRLDLVGQQPAAMSGGGDGEGGEVMAARPEVWRSWRRVRGDGGVGYHDKPSSSCATGARRRREVAGGWRDSGGDGRAAAAAVVATVTMVGGGMAILDG
uniref:DUF834 domain-containing protein n=1 Tax=Oryza glumipatula TaxID=40148 RepID=A0A0E0A9B4_9ORYZ